MINRSSVQKYLMFLPRFTAHSPDLPHPPSVDIHRQSLEIHNQGFPPPAGYEGPLVEKIVRDVPSKSGGLSQKKELKYLDRVKATRTLPFTITDGLESGKGKGKSKGKARKRGRTKTWEYRLYLGIETEMIAYPPGAGRNDDFLVHLNVDLPSELNHRFERQLRESHKSFKAATNAFNKWFSQVSNSRYTCEKLFKLKFDEDKDTYVFRGEQSTSTASQVPRRGHHNPLAGANAARRTIAPSGTRKGGEPPAKRFARARNPHGQDIDSHHTDIDSDSDSNPQLDIANDLPDAVDSDSGDEESMMCLLNFYLIDHTVATGPLRKFTPVKKKHFAFAIEVKFASTMSDIFEALKKKFRKPPSALAVNHANAVSRYFGAALEYIEGVSDAETVFRDTILDNDAHIGMNGSLISVYKTRGKDVGSFEYEHFDDLNFGLGKAWKGYHHRSSTTKDEVPLHMLFVLPVPSPVSKPQAEGTKLKKKKSGPPVHRPKPTRPSSAIEVDMIWNDNDASHPDDIDIDRVEPPTRMATKPASPQALLEAHRYSTEPVVKDTTKTGPGKTTNIDLTGGPPMSAKAQENVRRQLEELAAGLTCLPPNAGFEALMSNDQKLRWANDLLHRNDNDLEVTVNIPPKSIRDTLGWRYPKVASIDSLVATEASTLLSPAAVQPAHRALELPMKGVDLPQHLDAPLGDLTRDLEQKDMKLKELKLQARQIELEVDRTLNARQTIMQAIELQRQKDAKKEKLLAEERRIKEEGRRIKEELSALS